MELNRVVSEIRFESSFLFDDGRTKNSITKEMKKDFELFEYDDKDNKLIFINKSDKMKCILFHNRIFLEIDQNKDINKFNNLASRVIPFLMNKLEIEYTSRVGVRAFYIQNNIFEEEKSSDMITKQYFNNFLLDFINKSKGKKSINPSLSFKINATEELTLGIIVGYHQEGSGDINSKGEVNITNLESVSPMIDLDIYTVVQKNPDQMKGLLKGCCDNLTAYSHKIWNKEIF
jgi:hypothetical protein